MSKPVNATDATFQSEVSADGKAVLVDFWAPWCGPCRIVGPVLEEIASEEADRVKIVKVNVDSSSLASQFGVMNIPTMILFKDGQEVARLRREIALHGGLLPGTQGRRSAPSGPVGPRGGQRRVRPPRHASGPEPSEPEPPGFIDSQISLHSGQTGNLSGFFVGTQTLPHSAMTGAPERADSRIFSLRT